MIVVDASAVLEVLLNTVNAAAIAARLFDEGETLHAPHLIDVEVAQVVRRYARSGALDGTRGAQALEDLGDFPLSRYPHQPLLPRMWQLRDNVTAFDAAYIALAEALDAPLLTRDTSLARAPGHGARIVVI